MRRRLRDYQTRAVEYLRRRGGIGALFMEMRLGKSLVALRYLAQRSDVRRVLIVGPYSVLPGWVDEIEKENAGAYFYLTGTKKERALYQSKIKDDPAQPWKIFALTNRECHLACPDLLTWGWDAVIVDESIFIANPKAQVTKNFLKHAEKIPVRVILNGTPAPESELQYFTQLRFVDRNILGHQSYWDFRAKAFRPSWDGFDWKIKPNARRWLAECLARETFCLSQDDVGLAIEPQHERRIVRLSAGNRKSYHLAEKDFMTESGEVLKFAGERWVKMRRIASGEEKLVELKRIMKEELPGRSVIIWAVYTDEILDVARAFDAPYISGEISIEWRERYRKEFQDGIAPILVCQPECWKFGTTLTRADAIIFYSSPCGLLTREQVEQRTVDVTRPDRPPVIYDLITEDTIDEDVLDSLAAKESRTALLQRLRRGIEKRMV